MRGRHWMVWMTAVFVMMNAPADESTAAPIRALLLTGGCCHDYDTQKVSIPGGISVRANVEWTIVHEGGTGRDHQFSIFADPDWAQPYDVVVHNVCFGQVDDDAFLERNVAEHAGTPAVVIHCSMHSYRAAKTDAWRAFIGVTSTRHEGHRPFVVQNLLPEHPIMRDFPAEWLTPQGELYMIENVWPGVTPLAQAFGQDTQQNHLVIWINEHDGARVFGTTIGHHNETVEHPVYLDVVTRGLLWAVGKLDDDGRPLPGYGAE